MPVLPLTAGGDDGEAGRRRLLAVSHLWADLESVEDAGVTRAALLTPDIMSTRPNETLIEDLRELVAALDRRVPRLEREGERAIARDAARLKNEALRRIADLERNDPKN